MPDGIQRSICFLGIPTPYNEYTYHMIKAMEEKNDGLFDYDGTEEPTWAK